MGRLAALLVGVVIVSGGCFEEGGGKEGQAQAIETTVQGMIAFGDIHSNLTTNPGAAGEALLEFMKMPVAAYNLVAPPFDLAAMGAAQRSVAPGPIPDCLVQSGEPSCDTYAGSNCEAGGFTFDGIMSRRCSDCDDPRGFCAYGWTLPRLQYASDLFTLELSTSGHWAGTVGQVTPGLAASFALRTGAQEHAGVVSVCACTTLTVIDSPTASGKPRKLVNSQFLVAANPTGTPSCALVDFDAQGDITVTDSCTCGNGNTCAEYVAPAQAPATCGDGVCQAGETAEVCPPDCATTTAVCGNGMCELGEDLVSCAADCIVLP